MKQITILLALILASNFALSTCQNYSTDINGNYIPDINGTTILCPQTDLNSIKLDLNNLQASFNQYKTDTNYMVTDYNGMKNREQLAIDKYNIALSNYSNISGKIDETKGLITSTTSDLKQSLDATSQDINQTINEGIPKTLQPAIDNTNETKSLMTTSLIIQARDKNELLTIINQNQQGTNTLIGLIIALILASIFLFYYFIIHKPKQKKPETKLPDSFKPFPQPKEPKQNIRSKPNPKAIIIEPEKGMIETPIEKSPIPENQPDNTIQEIKDKMQERQENISQTSTPNRTEKKQVPETFEEIKQIAEGMENA